jgi:hypothetical protein
MPRQEWDKTSKWLVQHHGRSLLYLGGARGVLRCRALQAEVVQPRRLPDGLLEVYFRGSDAASYVIAEIATYPERRALKQAMDDLLLVHQARGGVPDLLTVVLRPKGRFRIDGAFEQQSRLGWSSIATRWKVVELWNVPAEELLAANDVGLVPWLPLTQFSGPPEGLIRECRKRIDQQAPASEHENLLAVTQVLTRLRFLVPELMALLGGERVMIESPLIQELVAKTGQDYILAVLQERFGDVPPVMQGQLRKVVRERQLRTLHKRALKCPDLEAFRAYLPVED